LVAGVPPQSSTEGPLAAGSYAFQAVYSGDANYVGSTSGCEDFAVARGTSATATQAAPQAGLVGVGLTVGDTATVTGNDGVLPTGMVTFTLWTDNTCETAATGLANPSPGELLTSNGTSPASASGSYSTSWIPPATGSYYWTAAYSGDGNYNPATSACGDSHELVTVAVDKSTTVTTVFDAASDAGWAGTETTGASAFDTATVTGVPGITPTGTVTYAFFTNNACTGTGSPSGKVTLTSTGAVANSDTEGPLAAGSYSFEAVYSGDAHYAGSDSVCEPFTVAKASSTPATVVFDPATKAQWSKTETTGASAFDTATVAGVPGVIPTGSVTYTFFTNDACSGTGTPAGTVTLTPTGMVPNSKTEGPLAAGVYSFRAVYTGDANFAAADSACEPFPVAVSSSQAASTVFDASTNKALTGTEITGASAFDTSTVTGAAGVTPTGTVTYTFFDNDTCTGTGSPAGTVTLTAAGTVPNSTTQGPLEAGPYSFQTNYSGDANYHASTGACETFTIATAPPPAPLTPITDVTIPVTG
jgi:hypothetical protein